MTATAARQSWLSRLLAAMRAGQGEPERPVPVEFRLQFDPKRILTPEEIAIVFKLLHLTIATDKFNDTVPEFLRDCFRPVEIGQEGERTRRPDWPRKAKSA